MPAGVEADARDADRARDESRRCPARTSPWRCRSECQSPKATEFWIFTGCLVPLRVLAVWRKSPHAEAGLPQPARASGRGTSGGSLVRRLLFCYERTRSRARARGRKALRGLPRRAARRDGSRLKAAIYTFDAGRLTFRLKSQFGFTRDRPAPRAVQPDGPARDARLRAPRAVLRQQPPPGGQARRHPRRRVDDEDPHGADLSRRADHRDPSTSATRRAASRSRTRTSHEMTDLLRRFADSEAPPAVPPRRDHGAGERRARPHAAARAAPRPRRTARSPSDGAGSPDSRDVRSSRPSSLSTSGLYRRAAASGPGARRRRGEPRPARRSGRTQTLRLVEETLSRSRSAAGSRPRPAGDAPGRRSTSRAVPPDLPQLDEVEVAAVSVFTPGAARRDSRLRGARSTPT